MKSYSAARGMFGFLEFLSWFGIIIGAIIALVAAGGVSQVRGFGNTSGVGMMMLAAAPGIGMALSGFFGLVFVQIGRAGVDTAEYSQQMLKVARDQLAVSNQMLTGSQRLEHGFTALKAPEPPSGQSADFGQMTATDGTGMNTPQESAVPDEPQLSAKTSNSPETGPMQLDRPAPQLQDQRGVQTALRMRFEQAGADLDARVPVPNVHGRRRVEEKHGRFYAKDQAFGTRAEAVEYLKRQTD